MDTKQIDRRTFLTGLGVSAAALGLSSLTACLPAAKAKALSLSHGNDANLFPVYDGTKYTKKDFTALTKNDKLGLSAENIQAHLGLYEGYITKVNLAETEMRSGNINEASIKNLAFALNGMALHDIYFSNMSTAETKRSKALNKAIEASYGSFDKYFTNLTSIADQVTGWSITALNLLNGKILNYGLADHSANFPNFIVPILALDVYEHAYVIDFSKEGKAKYIEVFSGIIDWDLVSRRYDAMTVMFS
jgi:Fe-Mn family superoxide dismutase